MEHAHEREVEIDAALAVSKRKVNMARTLAEQNKQLALKAFMRSSTGTTTTPRPRCGLRATFSTAPTLARVATAYSSACGRFQRRFRYENALAVAAGDYVVLHGRFSGQGQPRPMIVVNILRIENGRLAEHWDVIQDESTAAESKSGLPMIGDHFLVLE